MGTDTTHFSRLSEEAQDLIVSATLGEFDASGPPEMSDSVREEIRQWAEAPDNVEETLTGRSFNSDGI